eukprot:4813199-Pyramimonas_sp.AAC.1
MVYTKVERVCRKGAHSLALTSASGQQYISGTNSLTSAVSVITPCQVAGTLANMRSAWSKRPPCETTRRTTRD